MSTSQAWRLLPSVALGAVSTTAGGYAVNELTNRGPAWWWAAVGVSLVGLIAGTLWVTACSRMHRTIGRLQPPRP